MTTENEGLAPAATGNEAEKVQHPEDNPTDAVEQAFRWRDHLAVHPAADELPPLPRDELQALADDIKRNGLQSPIVIWGQRFTDPDAVLLDGRHRLNALEMIGWLMFDGLLHLKGNPRGPFTSPSSMYFKYVDRGDPRAHVLSFNVHRRHLTAEQRRELIAKAIAIQPEKSDRAIAKQVKADHKTVAKARREAEATGEVSPVEKRVGADGKRRKQPKKRDPKKAPRKMSVEEHARLINEAWAKVPPEFREEADPDDPEASAEARKKHYAALDPDDKLTPESERLLELVKPLQRSNEIAGAIFMTPFLGVDAIDETLGEIEKIVATWNAVAEHLKAARVKAAA
jgi:hypothetical protein